MTNTITVDNKVLEYHAGHELTAEIQQSKDFFKYPMDYFEGEVWMPCPISKNHFVSNYGRVYNSKTKTMLYADNNRQGYWKFEIWINGKRIKHTAQRLVAATFLGIDIDDDTLHCHHQNGNRYDNRAVNILPMPVSDHIRAHILFTRYGATTTEDKIAIAQAVLKGEL